MKKFYEAAQMDVVLFETTDVIVASGVILPVDNYTQEDNETEVLI